jgi:hypothetical protein
MILTTPKSYICRDYSRLEVTAGAIVYLAVAAAAKVLSATYGPCQAVEVVVESNSLRWRIDGGDPSTGAAGNGCPIAALNGVFIMGGANVQNLALIGLSATGYAHIHFFYEH